jgi:hypothetical protein
LGVKPELEFEAEEGRILEATARQPLALVVEESGSLTELGYLITDGGVVSDLPGVNWALF